MCLLFYLNAFFLYQFDRHEIVHIFRPLKLFVSVLVLVQELSLFKHATACVQYEKVVEVKSRRTFKAENP